MSKPENFKDAFIIFKKKSLLKLSCKYGFSNYLIIDLIMMALKKIIPSGYLKPIDYFFNLYINQIKQNLTIRYDIPAFQVKNLENLINEILDLFENKFSFKFFYSPDEDNENVKFIYEIFEELINELLLVLQEADPLYKK